MIREAAESGTFDDVAGSGQPIPGLAQPYDPAWWARTWIVNERSRDLAAELSHRVEREVPRILSGDVTDKVRTDLESLNVMIVDHNESSQEGYGLPLLDVERQLKERATRRTGR
ncbi:MAG: DUF1992 domain-containing protein [bacterium]|nr:DUF1992 domain-containing protein [bacterium]